MAGQFPFSVASGQVILKGILSTLHITISQLEKETGLSYSSLQRIYNGETKKITIPVYKALKARWPLMRDEYLKSATLPIFEDDVSDPDKENADETDILTILQNARKILDNAIQKERMVDERMAKLDDLEKRLDERSKRLDERAKDLDSLMRSLVESTKQN